MNKQKSMELVKAMVLIAGNCRDEKVKDFWEINGITPCEDGTPDNEWLDFYTYDEHFTEVMHAFLLTMKKAAINGGIECDGIASK